MAITEPRLASSEAPPATYRAVDPKLFQRIVDQTALEPEKTHAEGVPAPPQRHGGGS